MIVTKKHFESWVNWLFLSRQIAAAWKVDPTYMRKGEVWVATFLWRGERYRCAVNAPLAYPMRQDWKEFEARKQAREFLYLGGEYTPGPLDGCIDPAEALAHIRTDFAHSVLSLTPSQVFLDMNVLVNAP